MALASPLLMGAVGAVGCGLTGSSAATLQAPLLVACGSSAVLLASAAAERDRAGAVPLVPRERSRWWQEMNNPAITNASEWRAEMRVPRIVFCKVAELLKDYPVFHCRSNVGARAVSVEKQLACFLLRVGNGTSVSVVAKNLAISKSAVVECTRRASRAINAGLSHYMELPRNGTTAKAKVKALFRLRKFEHAVGVIDCTHMRVVVPADLVRAGHATAFVDRKHHMALTFQCITDCGRTPRFLNVSGGIPASAYDTRVLELSHIYRNLDTYLEGPEYLMGDVGYPLRPWLLTSYKRSELTKIMAYKRDSYFKFNKYFSGTRISVERAFGILKARFKGIGGKLDFRGRNAIQQYQDAFKATCLLHNLCADMKVVSGLV
jgi:hypothetical protein